MENASTNRVVPATESAVDHVVRILNEAWIVAVLSIGERTGLLQLLAGRSPCTPAALAAEGGFHPRYVQEWLWVLVAAGMVDTTGDGNTFAMRPDYVPVLTASGGSEHWSRVMPQISAFAKLEDAIVADFRVGQGLPAEAYDPLHEVLAAESGPIFKAALLLEVMPRLGIAGTMARGARVLDLGCGEGLALRLLAAEFPSSRFVGIDLSITAIERAREQAKLRELLNCQFEVGDIEPLDLNESFDLVMAANTVHDLGDPQAFFVGVRAGLKPTGVFCMHEISASADMRQNIATNPHVPGILGFSIYHCLPLSLARGGIAPGGMWGRERYVDALHSAGFGHVEVFNAPSDPLNDIFVARQSF